MSAAIPIYNVECSTRRTIIGFFLSVAFAATAYGTSQCRQWEGAYSATWETSAEAAIQNDIAWCGASQAHKNTCFGQCGNSGFTCSFSRSSQAISWYPSWPIVGYAHYAAVHVCNGLGACSDDTFGLSVIGQPNPAGCQTYVSALSMRPAQCGPSCNGIGDPINPSSSGMYSKEIDVKDQASALEFKRFYNSTDTDNTHLSAGWRHSFSRSIKPSYSSSTYRAYVASSDNSSLYTDEATACTSGFAQIKARVSTWANATASYANGACSLSVGSTTIGTLPILYTSPPTPAPGTTAIIGYDVIRDDGQVISFTVNGSSIVAPPSIALKLQQTSGGYTLTDANDTVESYDTNGKLLSVTNRAGVIQTMSYDSSGRLSGVTDNFGHSITLSYDSQGRLSTVIHQ